MLYKFIGDETDPKTKEWGLKKNKNYNINFEVSLDSTKLPGSRMLTGFMAVINVGRGRIKCPYSSPESFKKNWKVVDFFKKI
jgi:hypothetical protein